MDYTLLTLSLGLLLVASKCANSEQVFPESGVSEVEVPSSQELRQIEKQQSIINPRIEDNDIEDVSDHLGSRYSLDDTDKRNSLFRFGKRGGSLFRFGKRGGSLFRFGKRGPPFRYGKRQGSLLRFGKRGGSLFRFGRSGFTQDSVSEDLDKRTLFRFGKRSDLDMLLRSLAQEELVSKPSYVDELDN